MAHEFKKLWGPSGRQVGRYRITWTFYAIGKNDQGQRYRLIFDGGTRQFSVRRVTTKDDNQRAPAYATAMNLGDGAVEVKGRTVTAILRARLSADDTARAAALAMTFQR